MTHLLPKCFLMAIMGLELTDLSFDGWVKLQGYAFVSDCRLLIGFTRR